MALVANLALSFGFNLLSGMLKPRSQDKSPDSIPNIQFGSILYKSWGTTMCPGMLNFFLDPALNNRVQLDAYNYANPEEATSYSSFLVSNPLNCSLLSLRVNGQVAASKITLMPLSREFKGARDIEPVTGLRKVNDFKFRFLNGTQATSDPIYVKGSHPELVYSGQAAVVIDSALRVTYGGRGSSVSAILSNRSTGVITPSGGIIGLSDEPVTLSYPTAVSTNPFVALNTAPGGVSYLNVPHGFQYLRRLANFSLVKGGIYGTSLQRVTSYPWFVFGTGSETHYTDRSTPAPLTIYTSGSGSTPAGTPGSSVLLTYAAASAVVSTNKVRVYKNGGTSREITLSANHSSPFASKGGQIYAGSSNTASVGFCSSDEIVIGWDGKIFTAPTYIANTSLAVSNGLGNVLLKNVLQGLVDDLETTFAFAPTFGTDTLIGFTSNKQDVSADISNLLAVFRKIVYQKRDGTVVFDTYPDNPLFIDIPVRAHMSSPQFNYKSLDEIPDSLTFSFRDIDREFDSSSIRVGGDTFRNEDLNMEIVANQQDAIKYAMTLRNTITGQVMEGSVHLAAEWNSIEPGDCLNILPINTNGSAQKVIVLRVETGADMTVRAEFINFVEFTPINPSLLTSLSTYTPPAVVVEPTRYAIDTEPRSTRAGLTVFTTSNALLSWQGNSSITPLATVVVGEVVSQSGNDLIVDFSQGAPVQNVEYYLLDPITGYGSFISSRDVDQFGSSFILGDTAFNLYGGTSFPDSTGFLLLEINENNTIDDQYTALSFVQLGQLRSWTLNTRKRSREPSLASITVSGPTVTFWRQGRTNAFDINFGTDGDVLPSRFFRIKNVTQNFFTSIQSTTGTNTVDLPGTRLGDIIEIREQTSLTNTAAPVGSIVNTYQVGT